VASDRYLVDSSIWIRLFRKRLNQQMAAKVDAILAERRAATNGFIRLEIVSGAGTEKEYRESLDNLSALTQLEITDSTWTRAARLGYDLRRKGLPNQSSDLLIATSAIEHDAVLMHADADFDLIAQHSDLKVESYAAVAD
jgi:predicted nucleic acid-binding protein